MFMTLVSKSEIAKVRDDADRALLKGDRRGYAKSLTMLVDLEEKREGQIRRAVTGNFVTPTYLHIQLRDRYGLSSSPEFINNILIEMGFQTRERVDGLNSYQCTELALDFPLGRREPGPHGTSRVTWDEGMVTVIAAYLLGAQA